MIKKDILQVLEVETKEDKYTFALAAFMENEEFRNRAAGFFGFTNGNYDIARSSIILEHKTDDRTKITPDLILYNDEYIAVIESKMFSSEGFMQTKDYEWAQQDIKNHVIKLSKKNKDRTIAYYYFTLSESKANSARFTTISWATMYAQTLHNIDFGDVVCNCLAAAIYRQAVHYLEVAKQPNKMLYEEMFNADYYWVTPFSIFASGSKNVLWELAEDFVIQNHVVTGPGHGDFTTDLKKKSWNKIWSKYDNIHLFIRCEWSKNQMGVYLNWENFDTDNHVYDGVVYGYVATKNLEAGLQQMVVRNKHSYMKHWDSSAAPLNVNKTAARNSVLRMLKYEIDCTDLTVGEVLNAAKEVIGYYEQEIERILNCITLCDGYLVYKKSGEISVS